MAGAWAEKWKKAGGAKQVAAKAASAVVNVLTEEVPRRASNPDAADELERRARINARGASLRRAAEGAMFGSSGRWIEPRPDWLRRN